mgnify:CR=1 FL=1|jgi:hypothetical protein
MCGTPSRAECGAPRQSGAGAQITQWSESAQSVGSAHGAQLARRRVCHYVNVTQLSTAVTAVARKLCMERRKHCISSAYCNVFDVL